MKFYNWMVPSDEDLLYPSLKMIGMGHSQIYFVQA